MTLAQEGNLEPDVMGFLHSEVSEKYDGDFFKFIKEGTLFKNVNQEDLMKFVYVTYLLAQMEKPSVIGAEYVSASPEGPTDLVWVKKGMERPGGYIISDSELFPQSYISHWGSAILAQIFYLGLLEDMYDILSDKFDECEFKIGTFSAGYMVDMLYEVFVSNQTLVDECVSPEEFVSLYIQEGLNSDMGEDWLEEFIEEGINNIGQSDEW